MSNKHITIKKTGTYQFNSQYNQNPYPQYYRENKDEIKIIVNTIYPGTRQEKGVPSIGIAPQCLFYALLNTQVSINDMIDTMYTFNYIHEYLEKASLIRFGNSIKGNSNYDGWYMYERVTQDIHIIRKGIKEGSFRHTMMIIK